MTKIILPLLLLCSCRTPIEPPLETRIRHDLQGHTMGGRDMSWKFQSVEQIAAITVLQQTNQHIVVDLTLHDPRVETYFHAKALLRYNGKKLQSVGLLSIEQIKCYAQ